MDAFPAFFPLAGATVVLVGDGPGVEAKARLFDGSPATIVRLSGAEAEQTESYAGARLVFIDGEDMETAKAAADAARAAGALVNVIDRPALSDFNTPSVVDRGEVVAAIGTGGAAPVMAAWIRTQMEIQVPEGAGRLAALLRRLQGAVRDALPDMAQRRAFLRQVVAGPVAQAAYRGDLEGAEALIRDALAKGASSLGGVQVVVGDGPGDLLTLRAVRALSSADVVAADPDASAEALAYARRDAEHLSAGFALSDLVALAAAGRQVARVVVTPDSREIEALRAAGVRVEIVPSAREPSAP